MKAKEYVELASRTISPIVDVEDMIYKLNMYHMLMGMSTEVGELTDAFKKDLAYKKNIDYINVIEELGDLMWYIAGFCKLCNFDLEQIMEANINKLKSRYPYRFTEQDALNRNLDEERKVLEKF